MIKLISALADIARRCSEAVAILAVALMLGVVAFNVIARMVFDATGTAVNFMIPGAIEIASYSLLILTMPAIAASLRDGMISVDILVTRFPVSIQRLATRFWFLVLGATALTLAWLFWHEMQATQARGDATQDMNLPLYIFYAAVAVETVLLAIVCLGEALTHGAPKPDHGEGHLS